MEKTHRVCTKVTLFTYIYIHIYIYNIILYICIHNDTLYIYTYISVCIYIYGVKRVITSNQKFWDVIHAGLIVIRVFQGERQSTKATWVHSLAALLVTRALRPVTHATWRTAERTNSAAEGSPFLGPQEPTQHAAYSSLLQRGTRAD